MFFLRQEIFERICISFRKKFLSQGNIYVREVFPMVFSDEEKRKKLERCCLMSDGIMTMAFNGNNKLTEHVLRILLERDDIHVVSVKTQEWIPGMSVDSHSARLDIHAVDADGVHYDIEMQKVHEKGLVNRGFDYGDKLKHINHKIGQDYEHVPKVMVLFLIEDCTFDKNILFESFQAVNLRTNDRVESQEEVRLYNMRYQGPKTAHVALFFNLEEHDVMKITDDTIRDTMVQYRQIDGMEASENMSRIYNMMEDVADKCKEEGIKIGEEKGRKEGMEEGVKAGKEEGKTEANEECCLSLLKEGTFPEEKIALLLKMSLARVLELKKTIQA